MRGKPNPVKEKLARGEVVFGSALDVFSPAIVELAGFCGLDFCRVDNEHAWRQDESAEHMMRAAAVADITAILRIDKENPYLVRKALEIGAGGVLVPHLNTAEEVRALVRAAKFPPAGARGFSARTFSGHWGTFPDAEWIRWSNEQTLVGCMIEDWRALENLDAMMAVEGLDFVLFGQHDYSLSLGLEAPQASHPDVRAGLVATIAAAEKHGKAVAIGVGAPFAENARKMIELGCRIIELGHDTSVLQHVWKEALRKLKG